MEWCVGCRHNGQENGGFTVDVENYFVHDENGKLVEVSSAVLPLCLLLRNMVKLKINERKWPDRSEIVTRHDRNHHGVTGYAYAGHDGKGDCSGRKVRALE